MISHEPPPHIALLPGVSSPARRRPPPPLIKSAWPAILLALLMGGLLFQGCEFSPRHTTALDRERHWIVMTNSWGFAHRHLVFERVIRDSDSFTFNGLLSDPKASGILYSHQVMPALGGASQLSVGQIQVVVSTNAVSAVAKGISDTAGSVVEGVVKGIK